MKLKQFHPWPKDGQEAIRLQLSLAPLVVPGGSVGGVNLVAGLDLSPPDSRGMVRAAVVVLNYPNLEVVEVKTAQGRPSFLYIPGLLAFRELPLLLAAVEGMSSTPDLFLADGQGLAHPRRLGLASHLGLWLDLPTIGCAKSLLLGSHGPLGEEKGSWAEVRDGGEVVGAAVRTREGVSPLIVSIGHRIGLEDAIAWVLRLSRGQRLPEPLRLAHLAAAGRLQEVEGKQGKLF